MAWVIKKSDATVAIGEVTAIGLSKGKWTVTYENQKKSRVARGFDGVVVTGPGPAISGFVRRPDKRIIDGVGFWTKPARFLDQAKGIEEPVVVAGSGGTSAAIAAWIVRHKPGLPVLIIGNQAALFTRTESFFENALFSDEEAWAALEAADRIGVTQRLTRGVVWSSVSEILSASRDVAFRPGRVMSAVVQPAVDDAPSELRVEVRDATGTRLDPARLVIDAAGFNAWWFAEALPQDLRDKTIGQDEGETRSLRNMLAQHIAVDLSLDLGFPGLHVPALALAQGPGFASLMVLGAMSDRILQSYT